MGSGVRETTRFPWSLRVSSSLAGKKIWRNLPKRTVLLLPQNSLGTSPCISELDLSPWLVSTLTISLQALCFFTSLESPPAFHAFSTCRIFPTPKPLHTVAPLPRTPFFYNQTGFLLILLLNLSVVSDSLQPPWTAVCQASQSFTISQSLHKFMSMESVMPSNLCSPLLLLPSVFSSIRVFPHELALHIRWPEYCSFSFSISPSNEYSGLISFKTDRFDLLVVQGTLKESSPAPQFENINSLVLSLLYSSWVISLNVSSADNPPHPPSITLASFSPIAIKARKYLRVCLILWTVRRSNPSILKEINMNIHWKDWDWSWSSNTLATWCKGLTLWKRPWCWERLRAGGEGDNRGWDGRMASLTQRTWIWANSGR